jgi:hypothetical protein
MVSFGYKDHTVGIGGRGGGRRGWGVVNAFKMWVEVDTLNFKVILSLQTQTMYMLEVSTSISLKDGNLSCHGLPLSFLNKFLQEISSQ